MKRILVITAAIVMGLCLMIGMTGCGGGSSGSDENTIVFWKHDEDMMQGAYEKVIADFQKDHPDVTIKTESFPYDEYESKLQTALMSKDGAADIYEFWGGWAVDLAPTGALMAMPEDMEADIRENCFASTYGALEYEDNLYGMPLEYNIECGGLVVNNKIMKDVGATVPKDWEDLRTQAAKAVQMDGDKVTMKGFDFVNWDGVMFLWTSMILSQGGEFVNEDGTFDVTTPEAKKAFDELAGMVTKDHFTNLMGIDDASESEGIMELYMDACMMVPRGPWTIPYGAEFEKEYGKDYSYVKMPFYSDKEAFVAETGWCVGGSARSSEAKQELAKEFLAYLYSDEVMEEFNITCAQVTPKKSIAHDPAYLEGYPYAEPLVDILDKGRYIGNYNTDKLKKIINDVFSSYCKDGYPDADAALKDMETRLNKM